MSRFRLELWSTLEAAGGVRLVAPIVLARDVVERATVEGEHAVSFTIPWDHPGRRPLGTEPVANFRRGQVVRFVRPDLSWTEHRIVAVTTRREGRGRKALAVRAEGVLNELAVRGLIHRSQAGGHTPVAFDALALTVAQHLDTYILPALAAAGQAFWSRGTIEHVTPLDISYDSDTPLSGLRKIQHAATLELAVSATATGYAINLVRQIGAGLEPLVVHARRTLTDLSFEDSASEQATRIYAYGAGYAGKRAIIGDAEWEVQQLWGSGAGEGTPALPAGRWRVLLRDPAGGPGPIQYDNQFVPPDPGEPGADELPMQRHYLHLVDHADALKLPIMATYAASQKVDVDWPTQPSIINGANTGTVRARIEADETGTQLSFVERPDLVFTPETGVRTGIVRRDDVPYTNNLCANPLGRLWPTGATLPSGWGTDGQTALVLSRETDPRYWESAGVGIRARFNGIAEWNRHISGPHAPMRKDAQGYLSYMARITTLVGRVRVSLAVERPDSAPAWVFTGLTTRRYLTPDYTGLFTLEEVLPDQTNIQYGVPEDIGMDAAWDLAKYPLYLGQAWVVIQPGREEDGSIIWPTEFIVHGVQITNTQSNLPLLEGTGGTRLHQLANARLAVYSEPAMALRVNFADLAADEGLAFPFPTVTLGRPVEARDPELDLAFATRITGVRRDWSRKLLPEVQLADERTSLTRLLTSRQQPSRALPQLTDPGTRGRSFEPDPGGP